MKRTGKFLALLSTGASVFALEGCLGKDYFALTGQRVAVSLMDTIILTAVTPIFEAINPNIDLTPEPEVTTE